MKIPSRLPLFSRLLAAGLATSWLVLSQEPRSGIVASAVAQTATGSPAPAAASEDAARPPLDARVPAAGMAHTDAKGRHLAPHGTFYLLSYVSAKTDHGVDGFDPGQEVHVVSVNRPAQTLVVSDGHAQVEVPPSKLTNDLDIAALVREKDAAKQSRITAYIQSEQVAYDKAERQAADATAKDLQQHKRAQAAAAAAAEQAPVQETAAPVEAADYNNGYYDEGGFGYGSPYEYFVERPARNRSQGRESVATAAAQGKTEAPAASGIAARPK